MLRLPRLMAPQPPPPPTLQGWLPVQDVADGVMVRADGSLVAAVRVTPAPFALLSAGERDRRITAMREALQGLTGAAQIVCVPRPVDLDGYLAHLGGLLAGATGTRRALLTGYLRYVQGLAAGGEAVERRFYVLLPGEGQAPGAAGDLLQRAAEFAAALSRAELDAHVGDQSELLDLLFSFLHPLQAAFERAVAPVAAPRYVPEVEATADAPR